MQHIGKFLGFLLAYYYTKSFFGGLIGLYLGHLADKKRFEHTKVSSSVFGKSLTRQSLFRQTTFAVLGHIAKAKGRVTEDDIHLARQLMVRLGLDAENQQLAQQAFTLGKESNFPLRQALHEFREACKPQVQFFVEVQMQAALQDGNLDPNEQKILLTIADTLGISQIQFQRMLAMLAAARHFSSGYYQQGYQQQGSSYGGYQQSSSAPSLNDAYKVLGVSESDDQNKVKRAYRKLMNEHHPDKLVSKGLPPEMMEMAKEKAQQIQAAYDLICKHKGWK